MINAFFFFLPFYRDCSLCCGGLLGRLVSDDMVGILPESRAIRLVFLAYQRYIYATLPYLADSFGRLANARVFLRDSLK